MEGKDGRLPSSEVRDPDESEWRNGGCCCCEWCVGALSPTDGLILMEGAAPCCSRYDLAGYIECCCG